MADTEKRTRGGPRISDADRFRYIGFEVFPGKPKDLFRNEAERDKYVKQVLEKRHGDETLRDKCTLMEERVGAGERIILTIASLVMLASLFLPWYSAYVEVARAATPVPAEQAAVVPEVDAVQPDSLAEAVGDSLPDNVADEQVMTVADNPPAETPPTAAAATESAPTGSMTHAGERSNQEIITGHFTKRSAQKVYTELSGLGALVSIGTVGGKVFSSGFVLIISGVLMLIFGLLCIGLPALNLYGIYGLKGTPDQKALKLKRLLRFNWYPLIILGVVIALSFFGASYGFDARATFASLGDSYSVATLFNSLTYGLFIAVAASVMVAAKGIEI